MKSIHWKLVLTIQVLVAGAFVTVYAAAPSTTQDVFREQLTGARQAPVVHIDRKYPIRIVPQYDVPLMASDADLAGVLQKILPKFPRKHLKPNIAEHALRTWSIDATFDEPGVMSGAELRDVLINYGRFLASWDDDVPPLLQEASQGVAVNWGPEHGQGASVHHDHWLASLTEAGISIDEPVYTPSSRKHTIRDVLEQALGDFHLDERETEWSAMAFGLWLPPCDSWINDQGRTISFDLIAERLLRGDKRLGVCCGTHRLYSLVVLLRLDDEFGILSGSTRIKIMSHLEQIRDLISQSQFPDGYWNSNWSEGSAALGQPDEDELHTKVIATGHHLEWLALAPESLHPPRDVLLKAANWVIRTTLEQPDATILEKYTFYSHVGNALALWRGTFPFEFWQEWNAAHSKQ